MKTLQNSGRLALMLFAAVFFLSSQIKSQNLDVPYVPTPEEVVNRMLDLTNVGPGDYVIDLGSGDGRIVIAAAQRGAIGHGIDLNPVRVKEAEENAIKGGVADKVVFLEGDLFKADVSRATVITMYLLSTVNLKLKPVLLEQLRPGTRIVSHSFSMGDWEADEHSVVNNRNVYFWIIPAKVEGTWEWTLNGERYTMNATQEFQKVEMQVNSGNRKLSVEESLLKGERITFTAKDNSSGNHIIFNGRVDNGRITGTAQVHAGQNRTVSDWSAILRR